MRGWREFRGIGFLTDKETTGLMGLATLVGVAVGAGGALLILLVTWVGDRVDRVVEGGDYRFLLWLAIVPIALFLAWWIADRFSPESSGGGVPATAAALAVHGGYLSTKSIVVKTVTSALTLGGGGSGGREGPIVQIGGAIASAISRRFHVGEDALRSLVAAGAGAGIGASFNAPIAGMLFALEVILGSFSVRHMSVIVLTSVAAAVTTKELTDTFGLKEAVLSAAPFELGDWRNLLIYLVLALVVIAVSIPYLRLLDRTEVLGERLRKGRRPLIFGLITAAVGLVEIVFLTDSGPHVFRSGQELLGQMVAPGQLHHLAWTTLLGLVVLKIVATAFTHASGGSAGAFMPTLFIGAALGVALGEFSGQFWSIDYISPGALAVVGMATMLAAVARAPLTAIILVFELTGARDYGLVLPLMLSATVATFVSERFQPLSFYAATLERMGIRLAKTGEVDLLDTVDVGEVMSPPFSVNEWTSVLKAQELLDRQRSHGAAVINRDGLLTGIVTVTDLARTTSPSDAVSTAMTPRPATVTTTMPVSAALERMAVLGIGRLPVVEEENPERLVGMFRREDAVRAYHRALGASTDSELHRRTLRQRVDPGAHYYEFQIPAESIADGRIVREINWPEGSTMVSIRRGTDVMVPTGNTLILAGDVITAFGTPGSQTRVIERLNTSAGDRTAEIAIEGIAVPQPRSGNDPQHGEEEHE